MRTIYHSACAGREPNELRTSVPASEYAWRMHLRVTAMVAVLAALVGAGALVDAPIARAELIAARTPISRGSDAVRPSADRPRPETGLAPLLIRNANTGAEALVRLYAADGTLDPAGLAAFLDVAGEVDKPAPLKTRVVQLVVKAAYDLGTKKVVLVSSFRAKDRRGRGGYHTTGDAVDFQLAGVGARKLASYMRKLPRVGVGIYTHPKTQYVHVDARDTSYHWLDSSPPGRTWKEAPLGDRDRDARDAAWKPEQDLPSVGG